MSTRRIVLTAALMTGMVAGCRSAPPAAQGERSAATTTPVFGADSTRTFKAVVDAPPDAVGGAAYDVFTRSLFSVSEEMPTLTRYDIRLGAKTALRDVQLFGRMTPDGKTELVLVTNLEEESGRHLLAQIMEPFARSVREMTLSLAPAEVKERAKDVVARIVTLSTNVPDDKDPRVETTVEGGPSGGTGRLKVVARRTADGAPTRVTIEAVGFGERVSTLLLDDVSVALGGSAASRPATSPAGE